jgi:hypothetical protein
MEADKDTTRGFEMVMPRVSLECVSAVMAKAASEEMEVFAMDTLTRFMDEQPDLMVALGFLLERFCGEVREDSPVEQGEWNMMVTTAIVGVVYGALMAQTEANELTELFSEEGEVV